MIFPFVSFHLHRQKQTIFGTFFIKEMITLWCCWSYTHTIVESKSGQDEPFCFHFFSFVCSKEKYRATKLCVREKDSNKFCSCFYLRIFWKQKPHLLFFFCMLVWLVDINIFYSFVVVVVVFRCRQYFGFVVLFRIVATVGSSLIYWAFCFCFVDKQSMLKHTKKRMPQL